MNRNMLRATQITVISLLLVVASALSACGDEPGEGEAGTDNGPARIPAANQRDSGVSAADFQFVIGTGTYTVADLLMPARGLTYTDPNFNTNITRVTDITADGIEDPGISNEYAKADPENSDGSMVILRGNWGTWYIYDARNLEMVLRLPDDIIDAPELEPRWDATDPTTFFYLYRTELRSFNTYTSESTTVHDFAGDLPGAAYITTGSEGDASLDRRYWAFVIQDSGGEPLGVAVYDKETDKVVGTRQDFPDTINFVSMDMSGRHVIVGYDSSEYQVLPRDLGGDGVSLPDGAAGHGDAAMTPDGRDVLVYQNVANDHIAMADLDTGVETPLVAIPFDVNTDLGLHISGNSSATPGWVLVSTYGSKQPAPGEERSWMDEQLFMLELKEGGRVWRLADTHCYTSLDFDAEKNYFAESFAALNTSGTRVYFASNWENMAEEYTEVYVLDLPDGWADALP